MTKNKKRKSALREIAGKNGVSMTRAALLNDRNRELGILSDALEREKNLAWMLEPLDHYRAKTDGAVIIHCDSNSFDTLLWGSGVKNKKTGTPHYLFCMGTQNQRFCFLDNIRKQIDEMAGTYSKVIRKGNVESKISELMAEQERRYRILEENDVDYFGDLRSDSLKEYGIEKTNADYSYLYVFVYDWDAAMAGVSSNVIEQARSLIDVGKKVGIHFIVSNEENEKNVLADHNSTYLKNVYIPTKQETEEREYAAMFYNKNWIRLTIPLGVNSKEENGDC